jgi:hypothetical protein
MRDLGLILTMVALGLLEGCGSGNGGAASPGGNADGPLAGSDSAVPGVDGPAVAADGSGPGVDGSTNADAPAVAVDGSGPGVDGPTNADAPGVALDGPANVVDGPPTVDGALVDVGMVDVGVVDAISATGVNLDPAPGINTPGAYTTPPLCPSCPVSDDTVFEVDSGNRTTLTLQGLVTGATGNGTFFVRSDPDAQGHTQQVSGTVPTGSNGSYAVTVPLFCGSQTIKEVWANASGTTLVVTHVTTSGCTEPDIRATIAWDGLGLDWELHLIRPGGHINDGVNDCDWLTCVGTQPDWGVLGDHTDDPSKDIDSAGVAYGPEDIFLSNPENGRYTVMVEHWGSDGLPSSGQAIINMRGAVYVFNITGLASHWVWTVATIDWPSGTVTGTGTRFDCTDNWFEGCQAVLP